MKPGGAKINGITQLLTGPHPTPQATPGLKNHHLLASSHQIPGTGQTGQTSTDHNHIKGRFLRTSATQPNQQTRGSRKPLKQKTTTPDHRAPAG